MWSQFLHTQISKLMKLNSGEWHLNNITHHKNKELRFSLKRSTTHWLLVLYIPSLAFLASSWFALWFYQPGDKRQVLVNSLALLGVIVIVSTTTILLTCVGIQCQPNQSKNNFSEGNRRLESGGSGNSTLC